MYSQEEINKAIIYRHRLCNRLMNLIGDIQVLDKSTLLGFTDEEITELGKALVPVAKQFMALRKRHASLAKELDARIEHMKERRG